MEGVYSRLSAQKAEKLALKAQEQGYWVEVNPYGTDSSDPRSDFTLLIKPKLPYNEKQKPFARGWAKDFYRDPFKSTHARLYRYASRKDFPPRNATRVWFPLRSRGTLIAQRTGRNWATMVTSKKDPSRVIIREAVTVFSTRALMDMYRKQGSPEFGFDSSPVPKLEYAPVQRMPNEMEFHEYYHFFLKKHRKDIEKKWWDPGDAPVTQEQLFAKIDQKKMLSDFIKKYGIPVSHDDNARFREDLWRTLMGRGFYRSPEYRRLLGPPIRLR